MNVCNIQDNETNAIRGHLTWKKLGLVLWSFAGWTYFRRVAFF